MIDLNADYESFLDEKTNDFMGKITEEQVMEAVACAINCDQEWSYITKGLRSKAAISTGAGLSALVCAYWRKVLAKKHPYDTWESEHNADRAADKAEDAYELYETNRGG